MRRSTILLRSTPAVSLVVLLACSSEPHGASTTGKSRVAARASTPPPATASAAPTTTAPADPVASSAAPATPAAPSSAAPASNGPPPTATSCARREAFDCSSCCDEAFPDATELRSKAAIDCECRPDGCLSECAAFTCAPTPTATADDRCVACLLSDKVALCRFAIGDACEQDERCRAGESCRSTCPPPADP